MAIGGLLALLDDIATVLDDVALMSNVATQRTIAIAGDDLAVGAEAMVGLHPARELPIVWKVAKGSLLNKAWLVPAALFLSWASPWLLKLLLMFGGAFLCFEGVHKVMEKLGWGHHEAHGPGAAAAAGPVDPQAVEQERVRGAIQTDVILSAEIVVIALSSMEGAPFGTTVLSLILVAFGLTVAIYGLIAMIVKADDVGLHMVERGGASALGGRVILAVMPSLMKLLGLLGTLAMFLVGGGIIAHGFHGIEETLHHLAESWTANETLRAVISHSGEGLVGVVVGAVVVGIVTLLAPLWARLRGHTPEKGH